MKILGLPLTKSSMTEEFCAIVSSRTSRFLISTSALNLAERNLSNDYRCARAGYDFLIESGYSFVYPTEIVRADVYRHVVMLPVWYDADGQRRSPTSVAQEVLSLASVLHAASFAEVDYITQGSPLLHDAVSSRLVKAGAEVVDTASSALLAYEAVASEVGLPFRVVDPRADRLLPGFANVAGCIGAIYGEPSTVSCFIDSLCRAERIWLVGVAESLTIEEMDGALLTDAIRSAAPFLNEKTVVVKMEAAYE